MGGAMKILILAQNLRGYYLACELSGQGHEVTLLNLKFSSDEIINSDDPFVSMVPDELSYFQKQFVKGANHYEVQDGLNYWLPEGPINLNSEFCDDVLSFRNLAHDDLNQWLEKSYAVSTKIASNSEPLNFQNKTCTYYEMSPYELNTFNNLCEMCNVELINNPSSFTLNDLNKQVSANINSSHQHFDKLICLLSSFELETLNSDVCQKIYKNKILQPEWVWVSSRFSHNFCQAFDNTPSAFYMVADPVCQWMYSNFLFIKKELNKNSFQVWMKWPKNELANIPYLKTEFQEIKRALELKILGLRITDTVMDEKLSAGEFYAPAYVYNSDEKEKHIKSLSKHKRVIRLSPEEWTTWDRSELYKYQYNKVIERLHT